MGEDMESSVGNGKGTGDGRLRGQLTGTDRVTNDERRITGKLENY